MPETVRRKLWSSRVAAGSAVFIAGLGLMVLLGWYLHIASLIQLRPDLPPMTRNAATCFLLCGIALIAIVLKSPKWLVVAAAGIVWAASVLTIGEYVFRVNVGIDELLGPSYLVLRVSTPGRMAPTVAICFALGSTALLVGPNLLAKRAGLLLGLIGSMIAAAGFATSLAVLLGSSNAPEWSDVTGVALHTAVGLCLFGFGVLALAWQLEADQAVTPRWLPISVTLGVATSTLALWQALITDGYPPFAAIPAAILICGCLMAPILGLTIYQAQRAHTQKEKLQAAERNLSLTINTIPTLIQVSRPDGSVLSVNQAVLDYYGVTLQDMQREDFRARVYHPDDVERLHEWRKEALKRPVQFEYEQRALAKDGKYRWFLVRYNPLLDDEGRIGRWYATAFDIEDRKRAEALLAGEKRLLEMVASGRALTEVLSELCKFVEETAGDCKCGVYLIDPSGTKFHNAAAPSLPPSFNDPIEAAPVDRETGPCGMAACLKTQVIAPDIALDQRWPTSIFGALALAHGLRSCWSTPILSLAGDVLGTFAIYQEEPARPTQLQQDLISQVTHIASIAIERALSEEALKRSELQFKTIFDEAGAGIALVDLKDAAPIQNNRALQKMLGCTGEELGRFETFDRLTHEDEREKDAATFRELCAGQRDSLRLEKHFVLRDGRSIWANVIFTLLRDDEGQPRYIIAIHEDITERRLALKRLQEYQDLLDLAQKSARAMAFDWYIQQEVNVWSPEQEALYGLPPGSFDGTYQSWKNLIFAPDWHTVVDAIKHAHETGNVSAEFRVIWPDGSLHWLSTNGRMFFDDAGEPLRMVGFTADVTRRKLVEEDFRRSEAFLAQAQQVSRTGSFSWRVATDEISWSHELYRIYELDPGIKITLEVIRSRVHPEDLTLYEKMVEQARNGSEDFEWQYRLLMPDQSIKYMHAVARATRNDKGQLEYLAAVQDITRRKLSEEKLRRSEAFLAEGQHLARMGNFWWRVTTNEILWSEPMYRIFEFEPGTTVTLGMIASRVHPDDISSLHDMIERAHRGEDFEYEHRIVMPDGSVKYLHLIAHRTRGNHRGPEYIGAVQDVTQRRLSEEALSKARSELAHVSRVMSLGTLTASIAHEVNQPLSGIITNASTCVRMLDADPPNINGARETARRTIRDGRRAADVIIGLRALFARKDTVSELVDLNEATREVIALSRSELERNRVITKTELAEQLPLITGDRVQLQQVIMNLLRNGSDAMTGVDDRPRELLFRTEIEDGDRVRLSVQDAGTGFDGQSLDQLFQSFFTTKQDGMGIGLSVSRSIIENHHGRLWGTPNDGPGVTFSFSIPCVCDGPERDSLDGER